MHVQERSNNFPGHILEKDIILAVTEEAGFSEMEFFGKDFVTESGIT